MRFLISLVLLFTTLTVYTQNRIIRGKVVDCGSYEVLHGATISLPGYNKAILSESDGIFKLPGLKNERVILHVSALGYEEQKISVDLSAGDQDINIPLCKKSVDLDQVVVSATRTERLLKNVPIAVQIISSKVLEKAQVANFRELLEYELPGINFTNNGGHANINMLGFGGKYVLFLMDGERIAGETFDNIDYNRVDMDNVERIEIMKGAASSLYGSNAVGGVINIIGRKPEKPIEITANSRFASEGEQNYGLTVGSRQKWGYASITGSMKQRDPYTLKDRSPLTQEFEDGTKEERDLSETIIAGYKDYSLSGKVGVNASDKLQIEAKGGYYFKERNPGGLDGKKVRDRYYDYSGGLKAEYTFSEDRHLSLSGNYDKYNKYDYYRLLKEEEKNYENTQWHVGGIYDQKIGRRHSFVAGFEVFSDDLMTFMFESDGSNAKRDAYTYSGYTQQEWVLNNKLTLVTGLRYDYHSKFKGRLTPHLSAMYKPMSRVTLRGGYSSGFRSPTLKELYTDWFHPYGGGFQIIGSKDLKPEKSNNFNLSTEVSLGKTVITAMGQYSLMDNKISSIWLNNDTIYYRNLGKAKILGVELGISHQLRSNILLKASYTYVHDDLGKKSTERPHTATFRVDYTSRFFRKYNPTLSFSGKYFSSMDTYGNEDISEIDENTGMTSITTDEYKIHYEGYSVWRLTYAQPLPYRFTLNAGINNLFDYKTKFSSFYSSISPGRTFYVSLKWKLN